MVQRGCACLKLAGPYSKGWAILKKQRHTRVRRSRLGNTQNLGTSEFPKVFQNPLVACLISLCFRALLCCKRNKECHVCPLAQYNDLCQHTVFFILFPFPVSGIGKIHGVHCMLIVNDGTVKGGTLYPIGKF